MRDTTVYAEFCQVLAELEMLSSGGRQPETASQWALARSLRERGYLAGPTAHSRYTTTEKGRKMLSVIVR